MLRFLPKEKQVFLGKGRRLLGGIIRAGLPIGRSCEGVGICGACRVFVLEGKVSPPTPEEEATLKRVGADVKERLACQARLLSDAAIACAAWGPWLREEGASKDPLL